MKKFDVVALGELLIDFTNNGISAQGNPIFEANPGGAPCNVLAMLRKLNRSTAFIGKVGNDGFGKQLWSQGLRPCLLSGRNHRDHRCWRYLLCLRAGLCAEPRN